MERKADWHIRRGMGRFRVAQRNFLAGLGGGGRNGLETRHLAVRAIGGRVYEHILRSARIGDGRGLSRFAGAVAFLRKNLGSCGLEGSRTGLWKLLRQRDRDDTL